MAFCTFCMGICGCCGIGGACGICCDIWGGIPGAPIIGEFITGIGPPMAGNRIMLLTGGMGVATGETGGIARGGIMNGCCP